MARTSRKKQVERTIESTRQRLKSGVDVSSGKAKEASYNVIELARRARLATKRSFRKGIDASAQTMEKAGKALQRTGRRLKKAA